MDEAVMTASPRVVMVSIIAIAAMVSTLLSGGGCATPPEPLERSHCAHRLNAKVPEPIAFDSYASIAKDTNFSWSRGLAAEGVSPEDRVVHAVVGVDGDGSVFCTAVERDVSSSQAQRVRRALERSRYIPAVVGGRPHYSFLHLNVPLWGDDDAACTRGVPQACEYAATKAGESGNVKREIELNVKACEGGQIHACARAGSMLTRGGQMHARDLERGRPLLQKACEAKPYYCAYFANGLEAGGASVDQTKIADLRQRACEGNNSQACRRTAWHFENGIGVEQDVTRALAFLDEPCSRGDMWACVEYGRFVMNGAGTERDVERGLHYMRRACEKEPTHCDEFAEAVRANQGLRAAIPHYRRGCDAWRGDLNEAMACRALLYARENKKNIDDDVIGPIDVMALAAFEAKRCRNEHTHCNFAAELATQFAESPDEVVARELRENGCADAFQSSCEIVARLRKAEGDTVGATEAARRSCISGSDAGCAIHASLVQPTQHIEVLEKACRSQGRCGLLAVAIATNDRADDDARAWELARRVSERADADAPSYLATVTELLGPVTTRDAQSAALVRESCNRGSASSCRELAARYRNGRGVAIDLEKAEQLEVRACDLDIFCKVPRPTSAPIAAPSGP